MQLSVIVSYLNFLLDIVKNNSKSYFQQDNARLHVAKAAMDFVKDRKYSTSIPITIILIEK